MKKLNIMALITEDSAVGFYRIWQPLKVMERLGLANLKLTPTFTWGKKKSEGETFPKLDWFNIGPRMFKPDIIVAARHDAPQYIALIGGVRHGYAKVGHDIPLVVDTDDDVQVVRPFNPGYLTYNPESSNLAFNVKLMSIPDVSAITVSTPNLKEVLSRYNKPTYVVPNAIDFKTRVFKGKKENKKIRIGWLGSACHWENLQLIHQAMKDIVANHPEIEFVFTNLHNDIWANPPKEVQDRIIPMCHYSGCERPYHSYCMKAYVSLDKYAKFVHKLNLDIGLAPLCDNDFNRSKSNLRVLEYWADKVAVIASPVRPYKETIINEVNGLFAKEKMEWYNAIERLIVDDKLRLKLQENGYKYLEKYWNAETVARNLYRTYNIIIKNHGRKQSSSHPKK